MARTLTRRDEEALQQNEDATTELDYCDKNISNISQIAHVVFHAKNLTRLTLSHNKLTSIPPGIAELSSLEVLTLWNNHIEELPTSLSSMGKLRILNIGMNRLWNLPRGFGAFPALEVLDLTYNNLNEKSLPGNFWMMETLRALYLGDNDFETLPPEIRGLKNLQILVLRENDLIYLPPEIGELQRLRELHIQGNRLQALPPELGNLELIGNKQVLKLNNNPWVQPIQDQLALGISHVLDYIRTETYKYVYGRHVAAASTLPPRDPHLKNKKLSRQQAPPGC